MTWREAGGEHDDAKSVGSGLEKLARRLGTGGMTDFGRVAHEWPECVGPLLSDHTAPMGMRRDELLVEVDDPRWATQLRWMTPQVIAKLNTALGRDVVQALKVQLKR